LIDRKCDGFTKQQSNEFEAIEEHEFSLAGTYATHTDRGFGRPHCAAYWGVVEKPARIQWA
jgi:hypothetical protein